ncbi:MAG: helix-turn-helix domain-containing protein [Parashewanella sp.]
MTSNERTDWHRADIVAELKKRGLSLAQLGEENGLSRSTLKNALDKHYVKGEKIIADALGVRPENIWPSRYQQPMFAVQRR